MRYKLHKVAVNTEFLLVYICSIWGKGICSDISLVDYALKYSQSTKIQFVHIDTICPHGYCLSTWLLSVHIDSVCPYRFSLST